MTGAQEPLRLMLVDDQQLVRVGFRMMLEAEDDLEVTAEASDGRQAVDLLGRGLAVDVVLMDIRMPVLDGVAATGEIVRSLGASAPKVLVLTTFDLDEYVYSALRAGASGFFLKDAGPAELIAAIRAVHGGDAVVAPSATRRLLERVVPVLPAESAPDTRKLEELTDREREVMIAVARGMSNGEIAGSLFLAEATVKTHIGRILAKLQLRDRVQIVVLAYETGLVRAGEVTPEP
ncbi:response regulator transcription factor [Flexivirga sp. ID2601S]|uniref:Response regulator transcription factor n=1 Tax=Flexivirga aerilata TaxID=1656889 RepID=A0A849AMJ4_9MICO|nr:response regulator transcription factor [Flexivirga aerilata]NNG40591.1 response regulator transcription factor [Flexivirga aerilata]